MAEKWREEGRTVSFTSPLAKCVSEAVAQTKRAKIVTLRLEEETAYVAMAEEHRLRYAEALPVRNEEELVGLLAQLNNDFQLSKALFLLSGESAKSYRKIVRKYFRRVEVTKH